MCYGPPILAAIGLRIPKPETNVPTIDVFLFLTGHCYSQLPVAQK